MDVDTPKKGKKGLGTILLIIFLILLLLGGIAIVVLLLVGVIKFEEKKYYDICLSLEDDSIRLSPSSQQCSFLANPYKGRIAAYNYKEKDTNPFCIYLESTNQFRNDVNPPDAYYDILKPAVNKQCPKIKGYFSLPKNLFYLKGNYTPKDQVPAETEKVYCLYYQQLDPNYPDIVKGKFLKKTSNTCPPPPEGSTLGPEIYFENYIE